MKTQGAPGTPGGVGEDPVRIPDTAASLAEFADTLAHKLKNPLAGIMLAASRLKKSVEKLDPDGNAIDLAAQLVASVNELSRTIDRVVESVPIPTPRLVPVDANGVARETAERISASPGIAGEGLSLRLSPNLPEPLSDAGLLSLVLRQLALLGIESAGAGGLPSLETGLAETGEIEFRFLLPGLEAGEDGWKSVLKPFSGEGAARTLRLAVAHRITGWLGGSFGLTEVPGGGCEIRLGFPASPGPVSD
ncbi:MAG: histidine kinase dimerization/phospho-acceptor domain-containing protein [Planctomycetota bacterium]|jgi:signal transduction histidine kinase